ncbi:TetR/AcrR family transcriptional regulator [Oceaniglobus roseus]|uniref:TetR/AcrR family transcriptional regulator n=1 Tax=Oceaniglobus roseus TaxID=1737570 RepID=UPI000C7EB1A1|nr:TetR/AcrR family transcriptional regulator [Kandeliimicrobium roseum]
MDERKTPYHHGDLRSALLEAAEEVLAETGVSGFSLRQVARRVGVSHAAPAHHFGDAKGLLAALAAEGFRRFLAAMEARAALAGDDPRERLIGSGLGYLDFAQGSPALFRLMFSAPMEGAKSAELADAGTAAFRHLAEGIARLRGEDPGPAADPLLYGVWSLVHGFAELLISGRMPPVQAMSATEREGFLRGILRDVVT